MGQLTDGMEDDACLHDSSVERERSRRVLVLKRTLFRDVGVRSVFLAAALASTRPLEHVTLSVNPSVCDVFDNKSQEQACHQDGTGRRLVFDST